MQGCRIVLCGANPVLHSRATSFQNYWPSSSAVQRPSQPSSQPHPIAAPRGDAPSQQPPCFACVCTAVHAIAWLLGPANRLARCRTTSITSQSAVNISRCCQAAPACLASPGLPSLAARPHWPNPARLLWMHSCSLQPSRMLLLPSLATLTSDKLCTGHK
jgi:hypothetical protein